jgi:CubicO group peptidase (beta-lactamase class C family)
VITERFVVGHTVGDDGARVARPWPLARSAHPAGGIVCHIKDVLAYARFHLGDGCASDGSRLLSADAFAAMQAPHVTVWGKESWGLSWAVDETHGVRQVSHGGSTVGQNTHLLLVPEHGLAVAVLTNAGNGGSVIKEATRFAMKQYLGIEVSDPEPLEASEEELAQFVGRYSRPFADIELGMLGGRLVSQVTPKGRFPTEAAPIAPMPLPAPLGLCGEDRLLVLDGPSKGQRGEIIRHADGSIGWLRFGRIHRRRG